VPQGDGRRVRHETVYVFRYLQCQSAPPIWLESQVRTRKHRVKSPKLSVNRICSTSSSGSSENAHLPLAMGLSYGMGGRKGRGEEGSDGECQRRGDRDAAGDGEAESDEHAEGDTDREAEPEPTGTGTEPLGDVIVSCCC
jgi:hypothetical protein